MNTNEIATPKPFYVTCPDGSEVFVFGLTEFCKQNKLDARNLNSTAHGKRAHAKGYKARLASWANL